MSFGELPVAPVAAFCVRFRPPPSAAFGHSSFYLLGKLVLLYDKATQAPRPQNDLSFPSFVDEINLIFRNDGRSDDGFRRPYATMPAGKFFRDASVCRPRDRSDALSRATAENLN